MAEYATLQVRVIWEGEVIERTFIGESQTAVAEALYTSTVEKYRRSDDTEGVTVQLIEGDDVTFEEHFA